MSKQRALLIAEKPDLMRQIEAVYRTHKDELPYTATFTSQRGHLISLKSPDELDETLKSWSWDTLPIEPETLGGWQYKITEERKTGKYLTSAERYKEITKELKSGAYDFVINAGDPDQEGELLIRETLTFAKNRLPVKRFWTNDLTEGAILSALKNLLDDDKDPRMTNLCDAAYGRQHSDYRFGMNASRAATLKMQGVVALGRVETPMLSIVVGREQEIRNFKPKTVYGVKALYEEAFEGIMFDRAAMSEDKEEPDEDKRAGTVWYETQKEADNRIASLPDTGTVTKVVRKRISSYAPKLFKLATLQMAAGKMGYNDAETLSILQDLYEQKYVSYPRTDCEFLGSKEDLEGFLGSVACVPSLASYAASVTPKDIVRVRGSKKWVDDKALESSGHSALRPTTKHVNLTSLTKEQQDIYTLICRQFLAPFLPPLVQDKAQAVVTAGDATFRSTGSVLVDPGYTVMFGRSFTDKEMPDIKEGDTVHIKKYERTTKTSTCPSRFTSPDLIAVCESPGKYLDDPSLRALGKRLHIGTPATRSSIIRKLIDNHKYLAEKKEGKKTYLVPTKIGEMIIGNLAGSSITKVDMTGHWEEMLEEVRQGERTLASLEDVMRRDVRALLDEIRKRDMAPIGERKSRFKTVGTCPKCGNELIESEKGFSCRGYRKDGTGCNLKLWKEKFGATFTADDFLNLIGGGTVRKDTRYSGREEKNAELVYDFDQYDIRFKGDADAIVGKCPICGGTITAGSHTFSCSSCGIKLSRIVCGATLTDDDILSLLAGNDVMAVCTKDGRSWNQKLRYDQKEKKISFAVDKTGIKCPACKKGEIIERDSYCKCPACGLTVWKTVAGHLLTEEELRELLTKGSVGPIEGLVKKDKTPFKKAPMLVIDKKKKEVKFDFGFDSK